MINEFLLCYAITLNYGYRSVEFQVYMIALSINICIYKSFISLIFGNIY